MSTYEEYNNTSVNYDDTRVPVGVDIILDCLSRAEKPVSQIKLLDAGCGTGSYSQALIEHVERIEAVDASDGMLRKAFQKLNVFLENGRISFTQAKLDGLPFEDNTFDGIIINQVLHHIEAPARRGFPAHRRIFTEFYRVLRKGGLVIINTCSQQQLEHGYWYYGLIPEAADKFRKRFIPLDRLRELLKESGFNRYEQFIPLDEVFQGEAYFDIYGPLKKAWRAGDSVFALATPSQLDRAQAKIKEMDARGDLKRFVETQDEKRKSIGQGTFLFSFRD